MAGMVACIREIINMGINVDGILGDLDLCQRNVVHVNFLHVKKMFNNVFGSSLRQGVENTL